MGDETERPPSDPWEDQDASQPALDGLSWGGILSSSPGDVEQHPFGSSDTVRYERQGLLGRGGMGRVIEVLDRRLRRRVALKEVSHRGISSTEDNARLAREAWITAQLEHPGIVPVYGAGRTRDGKLYYTMRLVRGRALNERFAEADSLSERLRLLRSVLDACQAVAYAHSLGIVHRDLKPANIMIGEFGETQVVDWGLARPSGSPRGERWRAQMLEPDPVRSVQGAVAGTPAYMSPEQASGETADERSDVWGLGAVLYELLTGQPPFVGENSREVLKKLRTRMPEPISSLVEDAPAELIAITERALKRDPDERYPDARELAADMARYVDGRHVRAYSYTSSDHLRRFLRAWRVPIVVAAVATVAILTIGLIGGFRTASERDRAQSAERGLRTALQQADDNLSLALVQQARIAAKAGARPEAEVLAARALKINESPEARGVLVTFDTVRPQLMSSAKLPECAYYELSADARLLACATGSDVSLWDIESRTELWSKPVPATMVHFNDAAGELLLVGVGVNNEAITLNVEDGGLIRSFDDLVPGKIIMAADGTEFLTLMHGRIYRGQEMRLTGTLCAEDVGATVGHALTGGRYVLLCSDNTLKVHKDGEELSSQQLELPDSFGHNANRMVLSSDERFLVVGGLKGSLALIDLQRLAVVYVSHTDVGGIRNLVMSPDDRIVALSGERDGVWLWHVGTGTLLGRLPTKWVHQLRFVSAEDLIVIEEQQRQWFLPKDLQPNKFIASAGIASLAFSPDSTMVTVGDGSGNAHVWSIEGERRKIAVPHQAERVGVTKDCAFTPDGEYLVATTMRTPGVQSYRTDDWEDTSTLQPGKWSTKFPYFRRLGALRGGLVYALGYSHSGPDVWRLGQEGTLDHLRAPGRVFWEGESNHSGTAAVLLDDEDRVYRLTDEPALEVVTIRKGLRAADISNDGSRIALATTHAIALVSSQTGEVMRTIDGIGALVLDVSFSADDRYLAAGLTSGESLIFSVQTGEVLAVLSGHSERVVTVDFSPDGRWLATGSWDGTLYLWSMTALETPADELSKEIGAAWQMSIEEALSTTIH